MQRLVCCFILFVISVLHNNIVSAQTGRRLVPENGVPGDEFGYSVGIDGDVAVVGAYFDSGAGERSGSVYIFRRDGTRWKQKVKLTANDAHAGDLFGCAVSIRGNYIVVGARNDDDAGGDAGSAYIFNLVDTTWIQTTELFATDATNDNHFGTSVCMNGDYIVIGAHHATPPGAAYIFARTQTGWSQVAKLTSNDATGSDEFGCSVAMSGDYLVVGAKLHDQAGNNAGAAYVFKRNGTVWLQEAKLIAPDAKADDHWGGAVSISGEHIIIGNRDQDVSTGGTAAAHIFKRIGTNWNHETKLIPGDVGTVGTFGFSVSISSGYALVGAPTAGSTYLFQYDGANWKQSIKFSLGGISVAMDRTSAVVGGNAAYVYVLPNAPPYAPQNLQATAGDGQISLKWDANAEADFLRYRIYGGTTPNPTTKIDSVDGAANATKIIKNLITGTTYYFRITAVNMALQESGFSNEVSAVLTTDTPPAAPQGLTAIVGDRQIILKWRQNTEADFLRYRIYRGTSPNPITKVDSTNGIADTTKTFAGLINGTTYYYRMTAVDLTLNESGYSNEVSATPTAANVPPAAPQNLAATAGDRQITLTWTANSEADFLRYRIYGGTSPNPTAIVDSVQGSANTSKTLTGLSNGTTYFYRLTAVDQALNASGFSNEVNATPSATDLPPAPPQNLAATAGVAQVTLTWNANTETDFLRYRIYGGTAANPTTKIDSVEGAANTSKTIANLTPGTTYYFRLTAVDRAMHASGFSNIATAAPVADRTAPVLGSATYAKTANLNSEVQVAISASDISGLKNVSVHYRAGGAASFSSKPMLLQSGSTYSQTIPAAAVTNRGVEFYVRAEDTYGNVAQTGLHPIRVYCPNGIANPAVQPSGKEASLYRLFSIPLELDNPSPATFLSANPSLGAYDNAKYRWYGLERASQSLREYPNFGSMAMTPDMGFALLVNIRNVKLKTSSGTTVVTSTPYNISLPAGWSLIGNPFNFNIPFDSLRVSFGTFELWSFEGDWQINTRGLEPWKGYAIWLSDAATFSIRPGVAGLNTGTALYSVANNDAENWLLQIIADNGRSTSRFNFAGQYAGATDNEDALDLHQPVRLADGVEVVFANENAEPLKVDIRKPSANGHTWEFTCRLNPEDEVLSLTFDGVATVPQAFDVFLLEPETATAYNLRANPRLQFATHDLTEKRFQLVAGTKAYLHEQSLQAELHPSSFELLQNFPNPFNPATQIIYSLPEASHVEISVYNIRGEAVTKLVNERQESGSHTVVWNAEKVGSGVYFIRMQAGRVERIKKCLFVK